MWPSARNSDAVGDRGGVRVVGDHDRRLAVARRPSRAAASRISPLVVESRLPVGSSANMTVGCETSARAIATRCCWPPESSDGRCVRRSPRPTLAISSSTQAVVGLAAGEREREEDVLLRRQHRQQVEELEDEADVLAAELGQLVVVERGDLVAVDPDLARRSAGRGRRGCA